MTVLTQEALQRYAHENRLKGLTDPSLRSIIAGLRGYTVATAKQFLAPQADGSALQTSERLRDDHSHSSSKSPYCGGGSP